MHNLQYWVPILDTSPYIMETLRGHRSLFAVCSGLCSDSQVSMEAFLAIWVSNFPILGYDIKVLNVHKKGAMRKLNRNMRDRWSDQVFQTLRFSLPKESNFFPELNHYNIIFKFPKCITEAPPLTNLFTSSKRGDYMGFFSQHGGGGSPNSRNLQKPKNVPSNHPKKTKFFTESPTKFQLD